MTAWAGRLAVVIFASAFAAAASPALAGAGATYGAGTPYEAGAPGTGPGADCPGEAISAGMLKAYVQGIQRELAIHNYDPGPPDGILTPRTRRTIRQYQRDAGLPADGCASQALLDHLNFVLPKVVRERRPAAKPVVVEVQTLLTRRGYYLGAVDGIAGPKTREALERFQEDASLPAGGAIDQMLLRKMKEADPAIRGDR